MKRLLSLIMLLSAFTLGMWAQSNPNRLIVTDKLGGYQGFLVERIDSVIFRQVEGDCLAEPKILSYAVGEETDTLHVSIIKNENCWSYTISLVPTNVIAQYDSEILAAFMIRQGGTRYTQDFYDAELTGIGNLEADADYSLVVLAYDGYGVPCLATHADFHTPAAVISGVPHVDWTIDEVDFTSFTISFVPNADVSTYSMCSFGKGELQQQFQMFGAWMGFATEAEMVYAWGIPQSGEYTHTWTSMNPSTDYEVYIAIKDANGAFAEMECVPVTTLSMGGTGLAEVTIEVGEYKVQEDTYDPSIIYHLQEITFTPNDNVGIYHAMLIEKEAYDAQFESDEAFAEQVLKSPTNPFNPWDSSWDLFGVDSYFWQVDAGKTYYAVAMGKNANNEWGPMVKAEFSTPADAATRAPMLNATPMRAKVGKAVAKLPSISTKHEAKRSTGALELSTSSMMLR